MKPEVDCDFLGRGLSAPLHGQPETAAVKGYGTLP